MRRLALYAPLILAIGAVVTLAVWLVLRPRSSEPGDAIRAAYQEDRQYGRLRITYPADGTLFPPEIAAPTFRWEDCAGQADTWLVMIRLADQGDPLTQPVRRPQWTPTAEQWDAVKQGSLERDAVVTVLGVRHDEPAEILSAGRVTLRTSKDEVGAPIFYREVNLPFIEAVKDPSRIRWRLGAIDSPEAPPVVLENLPVCGNCHSFSADGAVLGMDVDYANSKGSYVIDAVAEEMVLDREKIITWDDYKREEGELSFGLLSQVSPDGRYVVSTVKDRSVFVPKPDLAFSQLFFPIKGILAYYDRQARTFHALPGADDRQFVHSNPTWSPDGKTIVFARSRAYQLKHLRDQKTVLLSAEECREFLEEKQTFQFDLYRIPFHQGRGGQAEPVRGASHNALSNYFPKYSPDGRWIVFCRAKSFMLLQPDSQLWIIPTEGGDARRLECNTGRMNSWHSWSPGGRWLVFSSKANTLYTQLMLTHIDAQGHSTPPVVLSQFTAPDRAANIPEFVPIAPTAIRHIRQQFLDDYNYLRAGNAMLKYGDPRGAARAYAKAVEVDPDNAEALCNLGTSLSDLGLYQEAEAAVRKALDIQPDNKDIRVNLGIVLARQRRFAEAAAQFRKALEIDPQLTKARLNLASALVETGQDEPAAQQYRAVLSAEPDHPDAHFALGRLLFRRSQLDQAADHLAAAIAAQPGFVDAHYYFGRVLHLKRQAQQAVAHFRRALELRPNHALALNALAWLYATDLDDTIRNGQEAVHLAEQACQLTQRKVPTLLATLAAAYAEAGRFDEAVETAQRAMLLAEQAKEDATARELGRHLELYRAGKPLRETTL